MLGQLIDVSVYHRIRRRTGDRHAWLRATGSTAVSQLIDSFVVLYIAFVLGPQHWKMSLFFAVGTLNYIYKMLAAVALIPLLYLARAGIRRYLGEARPTALRAHAAPGCACRRAAMGLEGGEARTPRLGSSQQGMVPAGVR